MTKPDDIPQDVWDIAASAYFAAWNAHDEMFSPASNSISDGLTLRFLEASARSIMAEREACAVLADDWKNTDAGLFAHGANFAANELAAAIRNRGAA